MRPERMKKVLAVAGSRQLNLTVILENVHDPHNISAVLRTCDSVGISEIYVLFTDPDLVRRKFKPGKRTSSGSRKWVRIHRFHDLRLCCDAVRAKYDQILATHLDDNASNVFEMDLTLSTALVFGNEKEGVSYTMLNESDGRISIPQVGMVKSLNISVACGVVLYEAFRQRWTKGMYEQNSSGSAEELTKLRDQYLDGNAAGPLT